MTARARVCDYAFLIAGLWLAWVLAFGWAGPEALSPPGATLQRMGEYLTSAQFWPHAAATGLAFAYACIVALAGARRQPLGRRGRRADPLIALFDSEDHALPRHSAGVRTRRFRQGCIRRLARNFSGRALCHRRAQEYEPRADQDGRSEERRVGEECRCRWSGGD